MSLTNFDPFGRDSFRGLDRLTSQLLSGTRTPMGMPMDMWQADDGYHVALDLPGADPDSVEITSERNVITIRAERRSEYGEESNILLAERPQGVFTRQLQIGDGLDSTKVEASYSNGVLALAIPVSEAAQPRRIQVQHKQSAQQLSVDDGESRSEDPAKNGAEGAKSGG